MTSGLRTFVVLTRDDKDGTLYPEIVGPFDDEETAMSWVRGHPDASVYPDDHPNWPGAVVLHPPEGGYAGWALVNARTATHPEEHWTAQRDGDVDQAN